MCIANKDARQISCFYGPYCRAFERTEAFKHWLHFLLKSSKWAAEFDMNAMLHPGNAMSATSSLTGALNMKLEDVSLRWSHASSVSERYRKYNETKKAVATAARSAFDNFRSKGWLNETQTILFKQELQWNMIVTIHRVVFRKNLR